MPRLDIAYRLAWLAMAVTAVRRITPQTRVQWAEELNVDERTIRRDLEALEAAGWVFPPWRQEWR